MKIMTLVLLSASLTCASTYSEERPCSKSLVSQNVDFRDYQVVIESHGGPYFSYVIVESNLCLYSTEVCLVQKTKHFQGTNYVCIGWTGEGITPTSGLSHQATIKLNNPQAKLRWLWEVIDVDLNNDGIDDNWATVYFGDNTNNIAFHDPDGDGVNNLHEYIAGTNPTNASSFLTFSANVSSNGSIFSFDWNSQKNREYDVLWNTTLTNDFSVLKERVASPPGPITNVFMSQTCTTLFFKIICRMIY